MVVKVKWFYHPEETKDGKNHLNLKGALFQSPHIDENDVQTISHKCEVLSINDFRLRKYDANRMEDYEDIYFLAGSYDPMTGRVTYESGIPEII
ncbi:BAH and coiled-coil domain-containing protein 1 [Octopus bimaculoides]|nr:BAH and coiled-coil domain-containing protein 1 [Octopus bimaculoides]|eukprot:XP_014768608.1 PREDICTED: BAH and coiled-coil domain-containing protein 1-like [Octopus bimaculoides]